MDHRNDHPGNAGETPQPSGTQERRAAERFDSRLPLYVDGAKAKLKDLSATGVGFIAQEPVEPGSSVSIGIRHLPDDNHPANCQAEVVRVTPSHAGFEVGARLDRPAGDK